MLSVTGVVISGDHRPPHNVADDFVVNLMPGEIDVHRDEEVNIGCVFLT